MTNTPIDLIEHAAHLLEPLLKEVVFVGGATVGLLLTDAGAEPPRPTLDVDVAMHAASRLAFIRFEEQLRLLGFVPDMNGPMCRYLHGDLVLDVMTDNAAVQGFTNPFYASAIETAQLIPLPSGRRVRLMDAPHLLATKFIAWNDRGRRDLFERDLEDVMVVMDGRPELEHELSGSPLGVRLLVREEVRRLLADPEFMDVLPGLVGGAHQQARAALLEQRLRRIAEAKSTS
ncbi:hypothetical protein ACFFLM_05900 [Deinococcus oregonensis]|uniref:Nucleotidyl transferase AbiEii/AbiGii toxin family protein n=1 Tax=Deinococcus oregonensis TaxID=1805970 RepID=A0ABV6AVI5_9DEIO